MIQSLIDLLYRHPKSEWKKISRFGGYISYNRMMYNRKKMERASAFLQPVLSYNDGLPLYFLTGKNYLYQTLFCIRSLIKNSTGRFKFILLDDGSLNAGHIKQIHQQLPGAVFIPISAIEKNVNTCLPEDRYPVLRRKRLEYPHIRKITDVHTLPDSGWKLVLDSDMLFFNPPHDLIKWLKEPALPLHMVDSAESYGYSNALMEHLAGTNIPGLVNVGAIGLNSPSINWDDIERWIQKLEEQEGTSYYLEQAISAMIIGDNPALVLNAAEYRVNPVFNRYFKRYGSFTSLCRYFQKRLL